MGAHGAPIPGTAPTRARRRVAALVVATLTGAISIGLTLAIGERTPLDLAYGEPTPSPEPQVDEDPPSRPNVVLIVTDDQRADSMWAMPAVSRLIGDRGVWFSDAVVSNPFCCPSRASILTGLYSHRTGVYSNEGGTGGWAAFAASGAERWTIATALHGAGYRTGLFGKYLNGYNAAPAGYVPPGWDRWFTFFGANGAYFDYEAVDNESGLELYGSDPSDYSTDVIAGKAVDFIRTSPVDRPFLLIVTPYGPHDPWTPAPRHQHAFDDAPVDLGPAFSEDVTDKPPYIRARRPSRPAEMQARTRAEWETLRSVDEMVARLFAELAGTRRVQNTLFIFMSDHGLANGQHRWQHKLTPYEESILIPMLVRYDEGEVQRGVTSPALVGNVDVAPTILDFTGASLPNLEGRSFRPVLTGARSVIRDMLLLEHAGDGDDGGGVPPYCGLRTPRYTYARYADGFEELYDLETDPNQLENVARSATYADVVARLDAEVRARCVPAPPGFAFPAA
jgi:N-acetylglucosamine-6-sulfatase